jgi:hypothetical protein
MHVLVVASMGQMGVTKTHLSVFRVGRRRLAARMTLATTCRISPALRGLSSACELIFFREVWVFLTSCVVQCFLQKHKNTMFNCPFGPSSAPLGC